MRKTRLLIAIGLLSSLTIIRIEAQTSFSYYITLSLLRGTWEYDTFDKRVTLEFLSDNEVYLLDTLCTYTISGDTLSVDIDGIEYNYNYKLNGNILTVTDPNGKVESYKHKYFGYNEKFLNGSFFSFKDTISDSYILFKNSYQFQLSIIDDTGKGARYTRKGYFRIDGNDIYLSFFNETIETVMVRYRDENDSVTGIIYKNSLYDKQYPDILTPLPPLPPPEFPPYPPLPPSPPPPHYPDPPISPENKTDPAPKPLDGGKKRDNGDKREKPTEKSPGKRPP
jgi:YD repeat-containing protein